MKRNATIASQASNGKSNVRTKLVIGQKMADKCVIFNTPRGAFSIIAGLGIFKLSDIPASDSKQEYKKGVVLIEKTNNTNEYARQIRILSTAESKSKDTAGKGKVYNVNSYRAFEQLYYYDKELYAELQKMNGIESNAAKTGTKSNVSNSLDD